MIGTALANEPVVAATADERHVGTTRWGRSVGVVGPERTSGNECFICSKHALGAAVPGGIVYDDGLVYAGHTHPLEGNDAALGYLMVEPRRHVPDSVT